MSAAQPLIRHREGAGPPLVLRHGLGLSWRSWTPVLARLAGRHDVIALDLPGFGSAPALDGEPTIGAIADAVAAEPDGLGLERPAFAGNSLGGSVALELARRGRAARVVVLGPAGLETQAERVAVIGLNETQRAVFVAAAPMATFLTQHPGSRAALLSWLHGRAWRLEPDDAAREIRDFAWCPGFHATLRHATSTWAPEQLREVGVPVRVCLGSRDLVIGAISGPRQVEAIPGAELVRLPGCGHVPMPDDPDLVADAIADGPDPA